MLYRLLLAYHCRGAGSSILVPLLMRDLTPAEILKFSLLADGLTISEPAHRYLADANEGRQLTPADYASTSGVILHLEDDVWVNAPIAEYNPNFVDGSPFVLDVDADGLFVHGDSLESRARFWLPPIYHGTVGSNSKPLNYYAFTHGDRVRISPIMGCAMTCKFCNIPYEDRYGTKPIEALVEATRRALADPLQPAHHMLISGGTPHEHDIAYLQQAYETILCTFPDLEIDIMMVPIVGLLDLPRLDTLGVHQFSINIELYNTEIASRLMRQKYGRGLDWYLRFFEQAAEVLGPGRVRSMLLVGLEPIEDTLRGVAAIVQRGAIPVLSPFRPSPSTPLRDVSPPSAETLKEVYLRSLELVSDAGAFLGPDCPPCTHNTLTLVADLPGATYRHPMPFMI